VALEVNRFWAILFYHTSTHGTMDDPSADATFVPDVVKRSLLLLAVPAHPAEHSGIVIYPSIFLANSSNRFRWKVFVVLLLNSCLSRFVVGEVDV
jgi:hypothetical protein